MIGKKLIAGVACPIRSFIFPCANAAAGSAIPTKAASCRLPIMSKTP
jgi:curli biogenesis system outer membrane secretion channel CsgG